VTAAHVTPGRPEHEEAGRPGRTPRHRGGAPASRSRRALLTATALVLAAVLAGCGGGDDGASPPPPPTTTTAGDPALAAPDPRAAGVAYLALGDSLAQGVQRKATFATSDEGYPDQLASKLRDMESPVTLSRIGCSGATVGSLIDGGRDCSPDVPGGPPYEDRDADSSQLAYAETYLRARGDRPTLVTIDIGANDLIGCAGVDPAAVRSCFAEGLPTVRMRLREVARRLQAAAGPNTVLAAMTYYDPAVALVRQPLAREAALAFHDIVRRQANPTIRRTFAAEGFVVARVDRAFGSDGAATDEAVDTTCRLTRLCGTARDFHPNAEGYGVIADAFLDVVKGPVGRLRR
jgi:lysophospholipase L1-like esterase